MSRDDSTDLEKEVTHLRLRLHHAENAVHYFSIEAKSFEAKWLMTLEEVQGLRKELQDTREDLDRANETLAKLFKTRA